jgi:hypothetical protein
LTHAANTHLSLQSRTRRPGRGFAARSSERNASEYQA